MKVWIANILLLSLPCFGEISIFEVLLPTASEVQAGEEFRKEIVRIYDLGSLSRRLSEFLRKAEDRSLVWRGDTLVHDVSTLKIGDDWEMVDPRWRFFSNGNWTLTISDKHVALAELSYRFRTDLFFIIDLEVIDGKVNFGGTRIFLDENLY
ncbi:MAG: hypothetical protein KJT03_13610 [Verrucomicrobiae bacterium]|nr:hypothetical protein [Verrucomicrobiae bacterium]